MKLLVATRSRGKQQEFRALLHPLGADVVFPDDIGLDELPEEATLESADTFAGNAALKAWWFAERSGLVTLADDSGLEVDALGGAPGVHSKRFAGHDGPDHEVTAANNAMLVERLAETPEMARGAQYRCVLVLVRPEGAAWPWSAPAAGGELVAEGVTRGRILRSAVGNGGFGYDPLFHSDELGRAFAEVSAEEKHRVSHRGRAVEVLLTRLGVVNPGEGSSE